MAIFQNPALGLLLMGLLKKMYICRFLGINLWFFEGFMISPFYMGTLLVTIISPINLGTLMVAMISPFNLGTLLVAVISPFNLGTHMFAIISPFNLGTLMVAFWILVERY